MIKDLKNIDDRSGMEHEILNKSLNFVDSDEIKMLLGNLFNFHDEIIESFFQVLQTPNRGRIKFLIFVIIMEIAQIDVIIEDSAIYSNFLKNDKIKITDDKTLKIRDLSMSLLDGDKENILNILFSGFVNDAKISQISSEKNIDLMDAAHSNTARRKNYASIDSRMGKDMQNFFLSTGLFYFKKFFDLSNYRDDGNAAHLITTYDQKVFCAVTCCHFVAECYNQKIWASSLGNRLIMQIIHQNQSIVDISSNFLSTLKNLSPEKLFSQIYGCLRQFYQDLIEKRIDLKTVTSFSTAVASRLGIGFDNESRKLFSIFIIKGVDLIFSNDLKNSSEYLGILQPFVTRHFLSGSEVDRIVKILKKKISSGDVLSIDKFDRFINLFHRSGLRKKKSTMKSKKKEDCSKIDKNDNHISEMEKNTDVNIEMHDIAGEKSQKSSPTKNAVEIY